MTDDGRQIATIDEGVTAIPESAFADNKDITEVVIPVSVTNIEKKAFNGTNITELEIPDGISDISSILNNENNLQTLTVSDNINGKISLISKEAEMRLVMIFDTGVLIREISSLNKEGSLAMYLKSWADNGELFSTFPATIQCKGEIKKCQENIMIDALPEYFKPIPMLSSEQMLNFLTACGITIPLTFEAVPYEVKNPDGTTSMYLDGKPVSDETTVKNADGSVYRYDKDGKLIAITGKRIYTVEEATALVRPKGKNTFSIRYR